MAAVSARTAMKGRAGQRAAERLLFFSRGVDDPRAHEASELHQLRSLDGALDAEGDDVAVL